MFGERLEVKATCPACGDELELALDLVALQPPLADTVPEPVTVGRRVHAPLPRAAQRDLSELARRGGADRAETL